MRGSDSRFQSAAVNSHRREAVRRRPGATAAGARAALSPHGPTSRRALVFEPARRRRIRLAEPARRIEIHAGAAASCRVAPTAPAPRHHARIPNPESRIPNQYVRPSWK
ncbi:hypothetical protein C7296_02765 [Burkholderia thailandensis]|nr:hypothetical protein WJ25_04155 [Burkholderia thailandensis]NOK40407.1 hypothetical protein [Burkholderia thailandensis]